MMNRTLLVVPCYNESGRLDLTAFQAAANPSLQILLVNDGSTDRTGEMIRLFVLNQRHLHFLNLEKNVGKGNAVWQGMQHALNHPELADFEWYGYWDADLATPLWEVRNMYNFAATYDDTVEGIIGSRVYRLGSRISRSQLRHILGRGFATAAKLLLNIEAYDSQCGAKLFSRSLSTKVFAQPFRSRWLFDLEILLRAEQKKIIEYPLRKWQDIPGGQLRLGKEFPRVLRDLMVIRRAYSAPSHKEGPSLESELPDACRMLPGSGRRIARRCGIRP